MGKTDSKRASKRNRSRDDASSEGEENLEEQLSKFTRGPQRKGGVPSGTVDLGRVLEVPSPRVNASWTARPGTSEMVLFGGEHFDGKQCHFFNDLFIYNATDRSWSRVVASISPGPRSSHQVFWGPDGKLYLFGGEFGTSKETRFLHYRDFWCLDPAKDWQWTMLNISPLPPARSGHRIARWHNHAVLFGGFVDTGANTTYLDDLWLFDLARMAWRRVDWLSVHVPAPTARSAFQFQSCAEGVLLYGGYCQVKNSKGVPQGHVLHDLWVLRLDIAGADLAGLRWDKKKVGSTAPMPRSGCSTAKLSPDQMLLFGGVFDEEVSDEFIQGTCSNDLFLYTFSTNKWSQVAYALPSGGQEALQICPRFNTMLASGAPDGSVYLYGGIFEVGEKQFTLDDMYVLSPKTLEAVIQVKGNAEFAGDWKAMLEVDRREMMVSDSESGSEPDSDSDGSGRDQSDAGLSESSAGDDDCPNEAQEGAGIPPTSKHATLKEYFDSSLEYWLARAKHDNPVATDKEARKLAFSLARIRWDEMALAASVSNL